VDEKRQGYFLFMSQDEVRRMRQGEILRRRNKKGYVMREKSTTKFKL
jgi:hypothetical protein